MSNEFDAAVSASLQPDPARAARVGFATALDTNPDSYIEAQRVARRTGVPVDTVLALPAEMKRQDAVGSIDFDAMAKTSPATAALLADMEKAKIAHDDVENLGATENVLKSWSGPAPSVGSVLGGMGEALKFKPLLAGMRLAFHDAFFDDGSIDAQVRRADLLRKAGQAQAQQDYADPAFESSTARGLYSGGISLVQNAPGIAASILTANPAPGLALAGVNTGVPAYSKYAGRGASNVEAAIGAIGEGGVEVATELLPMGFLVSRFGKAGAKEFLAGMLGRELPSEQVATVLQDAIDTAVANPDKTWSDYIGERPDAAYQTLLATLVQSGVMSAAHSAAGRAQRRADQAQQADQGAELIGRLNELATASKVAQRDPQTFEQFVAQAADGTPVQQIFIDANTLMQSGVADQLAAVSPAVAAQLPEALQTGGQIAIPVEEYAARIAPTEHAQGLLDHLKTDPEGFSRAEAQEYMQSHAEELRDDVERALADKQGDDTFRQSADAVRANVQTQLDTAARFTPEVNRAYSTLVGNFYATTAARMGLTPEQLFEIHPLRVQAEGVATGAEFAQGSDTLDAVRAEWESAGLDASVSESGDVITLSKIIVPDGDRGTGKGTTALQRLVAYADATGKHIALSPSADFGGNKKRLTAFYKRFGFVENKGKNRAFQTSESMYRQAPGKVLYQKQQGARGTYNPQANIITLLKGADLSTFLHESGHAFLEMQTVIAADIAKAGPQSDGERQIVADTNALLQWFGVRDLDTWMLMPLEEKRAHHEQFARGFEAYLFEGNAPSIELQSLFQRFRAWLVNVYRELKSLNVELTDEVRGVMDRMLATDEAIRLAEQGRSMMPLFTSAQQAGMTEEEFAAYQALGADATGEAQTDLAARGLRDMQWIHNARGRVIKQLQKESAARRAEVQMEARREVMSQPLYRAWQFLTGKITTDDKIEPVQRPKSDPDTVDPALDSLFVAIAKLGGIQRESAAELRGVKPEDKPQSGVFGKPVLRREGGLTVDQMAERLAELGYLEPDENGNTALRDFENAFHGEMGGSPVYSREADYDALRAADARPGDQVANPEALAAGRLDLAGLTDIGLPAEVINAVKARKMTAKDGLHPDIVAELFGFTSGDELVRKLAAAEAPRAEIDALTDLRMLERYGELASPEAIERAADKAIHNDARARFVATEANALAKATGQRKVLASAAEEFARAMIARLKVRNIRPGQYAAAEVRAAKAAEKASKAGDIATAASEKRNQLVQNYAARAAYDAQTEIEQGLRYLKKFDSAAVRKGLDAGYTDQIDALLERFDLRKGQSGKAIDKRAALAEWLTAQRDAGFEPDIPADLVSEAFRKSYKEMTVEEFRGLVDTVKQIEHLGRLKNKLLTARDQRDYEAVRDEIAASIREHSQGREADTRTPTTNAGRAVQGLKRFWASHIKAATWARVMDGGRDGGPMWEYFVRSANERGDQETTMRADATARLSEILAPVFKLGKMGGKGQFFPAINRSLNREARLAIALNIGNEGNLQRLLGGEGWTMAQLMPVLQTITPQEWAAVQAVWDHFESYRPQIAAKERRIYGKEPDWVQPGSAISAAFGVRGGYYPIKYDPAASQRAEEHADAESAKRQLQGAYTTATTRRSFTKGRVEEVNGRPLLYTLSGLYSGVNDVIHDLAWHEWLIDANRLLRSHTIDAAIREHYGPEAKQQFKTWAADIAEGEKGSDAAVDLALSRLRQGVSASGLGFNVMSAAMQPLGITQSIVRVGAPWIARGVTKYIAHPIALTRQINEMSDFMANRARTRFRELNELRNQVQDQSAFRELTGRYAYFLMMRFQQAVDVPTWWGAYEKAVADGNDDARAVSLADQAVIDAQGGGQTKDLAAIERGGPAKKLFTVFYSFMNTALNIGISQAMSADTPAKRAKLAADYALLYVVPAVLGYFLKNALTPGDSGDDDPEKIAKKLRANQIEYLMGLMVVVREFSDAVKTVSGANDMGRDYTGPAGVRLITDTGKLAQQAHQGEFDNAFRKALINVIGGLFGLPAAQVNRTITGAQAIAEGKTENPAALAFGFQEAR